jgi:hypothetical protein
MLFVDDTSIREWCHDINTRRNLGNVDLNSYTSMWY